MKRVRVLLTALASLLGGAAGVEGVARWLDLDTRQQEILGYDPQRQWEIPATDELLRAARRLGVDYLPVGFSLDGDGFDSRWGRCDFRHPGPSVLVFGDSTTLMSSDAETARGDAVTWPSLLRQRLPPGVQVCVVAEAGYHPAHYLRFLTLLRDRLHPAVVVVLLCDNDFSEYTTAWPVRRGGRTLLVRPAAQYLAWRPAYVPWLWRSSEAYRYIAWRVALARPDEAEAIVPPARVLKGLEALTALALLAPRLLLFYLPPLDREREGRSPFTEMLVGYGLDAWPIVLPGPPEGFRRTPEDTVHLNAEGHGVVEAVIGPRVVETMADALGEASLGSRDR